MDKELNILEIKKIGLEGLLELDRVCCTYNLSYFLAYGTLIGAVRHGGYIPWDDDIDIWMPRKDYEKLLNLNRNEILFSNWKLLSYRDEHRYKFPWMKLTNLDTKILPSRFNNGFKYGVSIDIFPIDDLDGADLSECKIQQKYFRNMYMQALKKSRSVVDGGHSKFIQLLENIYSKTFGKFHSMFREIAKLERLLPNSDNHKYCTCFYDPYGVIWETIDFKNTEKMKFDGYDFSVPSNYDDVLKTIYGDYMQLPPEEKRIIPHTYKAYYKKEHNQ